MPPVFQKVGPLEYRKAKKSDQSAENLGFPSWYLHLYGWRKYSEKAKGQGIRAVGFPVEKRNRERTPINFITIRTSDSEFQEAPIPGLPIANGRVVFGRRTQEVLITFDTITALTLHISTELGTVAVLAAENLLAECQYLRKQGPNRHFKICLNGNGNDDKNPVLRVAFEAAKAINAEVVASGPCSFFEIYRDEGEEQVRLLVMSPIATKPIHTSNALSRLNIVASVLPWQSQISGRFVLESIQLAIHRHVVIPDHLALIVSLWIMHTHAIKAARFSPLLAIVSPEYGTGKATLLGVLHRLCRLALKTSIVSQGDYLNLTNDHQVTTLFDNGDAILASLSFINILGASHDRMNGGMTVALKGGGHRSVNMFAAKALKAHVELPESLEQKAIQIHLHCKKADEKIRPIAPYRPDIADDLTILQSQVARWSADHLSVLVDIAVDPLDLGNDRVSDTFAPLLAIAKILGSDILASAESAAKTIREHAYEKSEGVQLLESIRDVFNGRNIDRIHSIDLVDALLSQPDSIWSPSKGKKTSLDQTMLAKKLKGYGISTCDVRVGPVIRRGFHKHDFEDAFSRILHDVTSAEKKSAAPMT